MIKLKDIELKDDIICVCVDSLSRASEQRYKLVFNYKTEEFKTSINDVSMFDVSKIMYKLTSYLNEGKELPKQACIACF